MGVISICESLPLTKTFVFLTEKEDTNDSQTDGAQYDRTLEHELANGKCSTSQGSAYWDGRARGRGAM